MYVQRYPFAAKAVWWRRYPTTTSTGKRTIFVATNNKGYELDGIPQTFNEVKLNKGELESDDLIEYKKITEPTKALKFNGKLYMFNINSDKLEEQDFIDENIEIITAQVSDIIHYKSNLYIRQFTFDCKREAEQSNSFIQRVDGLLDEQPSIFLKTQNFATLQDVPHNDDIVFYKGEFWAVDENYITFLYVPKEVGVLHLKLKSLKEGWNKKGEKQND